MSDKNKLLEEYVQIDAEIQNDLDLLQMLNSDRAKIIELAKDGITPEIQSMMDESLSYYEQLSSHIDFLKEKAKKLKEQKD